MTGPNVEGDNFAASPVVAVNDTKLTDEPVRCVVDENVGLPDCAVLTYSGKYDELLKGTGIEIGAKLEVSLAASGVTTTEKVFTGEITALELDHDGTGSYTVIRAMSRAHRLMRGRKVQAFRNMSAAAVVRKVAKDAGLTAGRLDVAGVTYRHLSQAGVSDWDFLQMLAQEHDAVVRVDEAGRLEFVKLTPASKAPRPKMTNDPHVLEFGENTHALRAVLTTADQANGVEVRSWDVATKKALVAVRPNTQSKTVKPGLKASEANKAFPTKAPLLVTDTPYATQAEATRAARSLEASTSAGFGEMEAVVNGHPQLRAGDPVTLTNFGKDFDGAYTVTAARHVLEPETGYFTTLTVSSSYDRSLTGLVTGGNAPARSPRMPGLATGIVTDIKDGGQRGWVRLKFPWLDDKYVTDWVRTVQWGGVGGGGVFSPEVEDEVLVGFEQGSLDRPYVIGGLYNGVDKPSAHDLPLVDGRRGKVNRRSLVSRTGNRVELLDGTARSGVRLASGDERLEVVLDEKRNKIDLFVRGPLGVLSSVSLTSAGITIDAGKGVLTLKGALIKLN